MASNITKLIADMKSCVDSDSLSEDARQTLLQAARDLQYNLETPIDTVQRYHYSLPRFLAKTSYKNPTNPVHTVHQFKHGTEGTHWFDWAKRDENAEYYQALDALMATDRYTTTGIEVFPFEKEVPSLFEEKSADKILFLDIGGGRGQMCRIFRNRYPNLPGRVIFQDQANAVAEAESKAGVEGVVHNFFDPQPFKGARIYFLRHVLHDWPDDKAEAILKRIVEAMDSESVLLIDEKVLPNMGTSTLAAGVDLEMMMLLAAQERSEKEWKALLGRAGLKVDNVVRYKVKEADSVMLVRRA
ncbi:MAG: hypothetical protein Q9219_007682 [cf. Caloplaca sp. 3 TL-2023]